jgi:multidrug resistance efflux pump
MAVAKVRDLRVRPLQSVDLCFEVDGVLGEQNASMPMLGLPVTPFDFAAFYAGLGVEKTAGDPGRLKFDSQTIHDDPQVAAAMLFALRSEATKAVLDKAIVGRENSFYQKYKNQSGIIAQMQKIYTLDPTKKEAKPARLQALADISTSQHTALANAYTADGRLEVVKTTTSDLTSQITNAGTSNTKSTGTVDASSTNTSTQTSTNAADTTGATGATGTRSHTDGRVSSSTQGSGTDKQQTSGTTTGTSTGTADQKQTTQNTDYAYRHPSLENDAQFQRAQISLLDEQFSQFIFGQNLPLLDRVFTNELRSLDLDVKRLQVAYLNTILLSPIAGIVTGVFKNLGDCVRAGEPVMRVENDIEIFLVGTLIFRGLLAVGATVSVTTQIFDSPNKITIDGKVVSVRGHDSKDDEWNVLVRCSNVDAQGQRKLPLNYNFDFDDTTVTVA